MNQFVAPMIANENATNHASYLARRRFAALDGLRCIAILGVIWHHSADHSQFLLLNRGFLGVDLFFVISGFLIVTLLLREQQARGDINLRNFYIRRALRIFPPYYALLAVLAIVYGFVKQADSSSEKFFALLPVYLFYVSNWSLSQATNLGIMWSLATEEQFYVLWPPIQKWLRGKAVWVAISVGLTISQLINFGIFDPLFVWLYGSEEALSLAILDTTFTPILLGVALAQVLHNPRSFASLAPVLGSRYSAAFFMILLLLLVEFAPPDISGLPRLAIHFLISMLVGALVIREDSVLQLLLSHSVPVFIGSISYGMYLYHLWALHIVRAALAKTGIEFPYDLFLTGLLLTIIMAWVSYHFFERYFLLWKTRFRNVNSKG
jgi:peptidoglycan/LPS O-acetylase OafA/YrhL